MYCGMCVMRVCTVISERDISFKTICVCVCILGVWQVGSIGDLRGDAGAPAHALFTPPPWWRPPHSLRAVPHPSRTSLATPLTTPTRVVEAPGWWAPSQHGVTPGLLWAGAPLVMTMVTASSTSSRPVASPLSPLASSSSSPASLRIGSQVSEHHVAEAQSHGLRVKSLDLSGLALQQWADSLQTIVLQGKHFLLDLGT